MFLFAAAFFGGALNAVAGGGSFIVLPALLYAGVPAVAANATNTLALWPGSAASVWAYRRDMAGSSRWLYALGGVSLAGGLLGGALLVRTSNAGFLRLLPWLMLLAASTFTFAGAIPARVAAATARGGTPPWALAILPQLAVATYGGYFPGGMGIMTLAVLSAAGMTNLHEMNGVKASLAVIISGAAIAEFILQDVIAWTPGLMMVAGAIAGGYAGASLARRIDQRHVRPFVAVVAWSMTIYFFVR